MHHAACDGSAAVHGCMGDPGATILELKTSTRPWTPPSRHVSAHTCTHVRTHHMHMRNTNTHIHAHLSTHTHPSGACGTLPWKQTFIQHRTGAARGALTMQRIIRGHTDSCRHAQLEHWQQPSMGGRRSPQHMLHTTGPQHEAPTLVHHTPGNAHTHSCGCNKGTPAQRAAYMAHTPPPACLALLGPPQDAPASG